MKREPAEPASEEPTFEVALARLEAIVRQLEEGSLGLTESLARYEEGIRCLQQCHAALALVEQKVELVTGVTADGTPVVTAFAEEQMSLEEKARARSRRRSQPAAGPEKTTMDGAEGGAERAEEREGAETSGEGPRKRGRASRPAEGEPPLSDAPPDGHRRLF